MPSGSTRALLQHAGPVYSAAAAACGGDEMAEAVAQRVLASAVRAPGSLDRRHLIREAVLLAVRVDPCPELAAMALDEREAVALARLADCSVLDIALVLGITVQAVKAAMSRGLRRAAASSALEQRVLV
jgi:Sigma-70, region 4